MATKRKKAKVVKRKKLPKQKPSSKKVTRPVKRSTPKPVKKLKNTARRKIDPRTGAELSRRQFEKLYPPKKHLPEHLRSKYFKTYAQRYRLYISVRDSYIDRKKSEGIKITKRGAMESAELKKIIKDLGSKSPIRKALALERTGRITPDQVEHYAQKFADEG